MDVKGKTSSGAGKPLLSNSHPITNPEHPSVREVVPLHWVFRLRIAKISEIATLGQEEKPIVVCQREWIHLGQDILNGLWQYSAAAGCPCLAPELKSGILEVFRS